MFTGVLKGFSIDVQPDGHLKLISEKRGNNPCGTSYVQAMDGLGIFTEILKNSKNLLKFPFPAFSIL
jgi:hypothetical protein